MELFYDTSNFTHTSLGTFFGSTFHDIYLFRKHNKLVPIFGFSQCFFVEGCPFLKLIEVSFSMFMNRIDCVGVKRRRYPKGYKKIVKGLKDLLISYKR